MVDETAQFDGQAEYVPGGADADFEAFLKAVPARWVVYLMSDADDRPVQLLCVKNLRASLRRRLGEPDAAAPASKRVDYRALVRRVRWRRVDSRLEADLVYLAQARAVFPASYEGMLGFRDGWWVHVDPAATFPRYAKATDVTVRGGVMIGPVEDKHAAGRLIELAESAFDLCRYPHVLAQAPHGKACAYKEMGKCPAPCDGTISMDAYRQVVELSARVLVDAGPYVREQEARMRAAAGALAFESARRIKQYVDELGLLGKGGLRHARRLADFAFVSLQRGPREGTAKVFLVTPAGDAGEVAGLIGPLGGDVAEELGRRAGERDGADCDEAGAERIALFCGVLFAPAKGVANGVTIRLSEADLGKLGKAYGELLRQKPPEEDPDAEGVTKELQSMADGK